MQKAKHLLNISRVFVLSDSDRNPDLAKIITDSPPPALIIYRTYGAPLPEIAKAAKKRVLASCDARSAHNAGIAGVHIPNKFLKHHRISQAGGLMQTASAHNSREISRVLRAGINDILLSPIFPSRSKSATKPKGKIKTLLLIRYFPRVNFIALGGINQTNIRHLQGMRLKGIAGVSFK